MTRLSELARVIRSKNVGPFMMALDVVFEDRSTYERVVKSGIITREKIAELYHIKPETITDVVYHAPGNAIKVSLLRPIPSELLRCGRFGSAAVRPSARSRGPGLDDEELSAGGSRDPLHLFLLCDGRGVHVTPRGQDDLVREALLNRLWVLEARLNSTLRNVPQGQVEATRR